jgi:hypothetical protein
MREYDEYSDDSIRLYTPVFQRVIILAAVIIAVPVLMWTITTFVRSYVARPRVPTLEHVASTTPSTRLPLTATPPGPAGADQAAAPRIDGGTAGDAANPAADMKQRAGSLASPPGSSAPGVTNSPSVVLQTAPRQVPSPGSTATAATSDASASLVRQPQAPQALRLNDGPGQSTGPSFPDRGIAWPNPNATSAPDFGAPRLASPAAPPARTAAAEVVPAGEPLSGPVPLPRHRPGIFAMAGTTTGSIASTGSIATGGPVPLPRVRPGDAPAEAASPVIEPAYGYRPGLDSDR